MESNREISPLKNNSYVRAVADQVYGDCKEYIVECPTCKGEYYKCPSCDGLSTRSCSCCGGRGKIWGTTRKFVRKVNQWDLDFEYVEEDVSDFLTCQSCGGSGREECDECHGLGILECPDCNGEGYITCPECNGTKKANCKTCNGHGEKLWALFMLQKFIDNFVVAPVTGFRTNAPYDISPENGPIVPGEPLSIGKYFIEDTPFGYIEGTKEPESFLGVNLKPYFDAVRKQLPEDDKWRYDEYYARAYMRDCVFIKYTFHGVEREFCYFPDGNQIMCDLRHPKYHGFTGV